MKLEFFSMFRNLELFQALPPEDLEKFLAHCQEESFGPETIVFSEGEEPDRFYVLLEGQVAIWKDYGAADAEILAIRGPGACFGEMSLIEELPRSATVRTVGAVRLVSLERPHFRQVIEQNPPIALMIMRTVSHMVRVSNESFQDGLRKKNQMLEKAYEDLQKAQDDLVRSERLTTLGKFASAIIHDLRNPLSVVKGYAEMLTLSVPDAKRTPTLAGKMLAEVGRINRMVEELLDYSRGQIRLNLAQCRLGDLLDRLKEQVEPALEAKKITLVVDHEATDPILLDADRLFRVLVNLVDNARKAMRQGGLLTVSSGKEENWVVLSVADTGEGMSPQIRERLFEPFFSASSSGGTGLGMLVVQNVVEAHHGQVEVESEPSIGTKVTLRLPLSFPGVS